MQKKAILFSASSYADSKRVQKPGDLPNVHYDIVAMEKRLSQIGFTVTLKEDCSKEDYIPTLKQSVEGCPNDAVHIVYFTGHGGQVNGINHLYPSDYAVLRERSNVFNDYVVVIKDLLPIFKGKGKLILILDACRSGGNQLTHPFTEMTVEENVYIAYGTTWGGRALAGRSGVGVSPFTEAICDEILAPNLDVDSLFIRVRQNLFSKHGRKQLPVSVNGLIDKTMLHTVAQCDDLDEAVYNFVEERGDMYEQEHGYFKGEDLIFLDAAQYFDIGLLDAYWKYHKVQRRQSKESGGRPLDIPKDEQKIVDFIRLTEHSQQFSMDALSHSS